MEKFCRKFVDDIFFKYDKDHSNILEKGELQGWVRGYLSTHLFFSKKMVERDFENFFRKVDKDNDNRIDRWDLYDYCLKNITPDDEF